MSPWFSWFVQVAAPRSTDELFLQEGLALVLQDEDARLLAVSPTVLQVMLVPGDNTRLLMVSPTGPLVVLELALRLAPDEDTRLLAATFMVLLWTTALELEALQNEDVQLIAHARTDMFCPRLDLNLVVPRLTRLRQQCDAFPKTLHPGNGPVNLLISRPFAGAVSWSARRSRTSRATPSAGLWESPPQATAA